MRSIAVEPLTAEAFAPFGEVLTLPESAGRDYFDHALANHRPAAWPSLSIARIEETASLPLEARRLERHPASSQSFVPLGPVPFLVAVAPQGPNGLPDVARLRAFRAEGGQGVTYGADVWHHPMTVLGATPACLAVWMWRDGTRGDDEFVDIEPIRLVAG